MLQSNSRQAVATVSAFHLVPILQKLQEEKTGSEIAFERNRSNAIAGQLRVSCGRGGRSVQRIDLSAVTLGKHEQIKTIREVELVENGCQMIP